MSIVSLLKRADERYEAEIVDLHQAKPTLDELAADMRQASNRLVQWQCQEARLQQAMQDAQARWCAAIREESINNGINPHKISEIAKLIPQPSTETEDED